MEEATISLSTTVVLAIALAMDCFAVSITIGLKEKAFRISTVARVAIAFGLFQGLMPIIGYIATSFVYEYLVSWGPYISFAMLAFIGGKMVVEAIKEGRESGSNGNEEGGLEGTSFDVSRIGILIYLAIATSIDALAVGVSYGAMGVSIYMPSLIIGVFSAIFAIVGVGVGSSVGNIFGNKAELAGGILLILLGVKMLF
ncbi:MAG: manganese efflux pump MntP family protein [Bacteroidales bacterium]|nr:manganese efflux pump MntP family protein [Bacteroidales bacterium]